jgi:hypothetical protein
MHLSSSENGAARTKFNCAKTWLKGWYLIGEENTRRISAFTLRMLARTTISTINFEILDDSLGKVRKSLNNVQVSELSERFCP